MVTGAGGARRRVLIVQLSLQPPGGSNGVASWALQALAPRHDVTVLSWRPVDVEPINQFFGTSLDAKTFARRTVPPHWRWLDRAPLPLALVHSALLTRQARRHVHEFDVVLGMHNENEYGRRTIQYIHYPTYVRPRPTVDLRWYHRFGPVLHAYYRAADLLGDVSVERLRRNLTLVNSDWTGRQVQRAYGITTRTLYPPVVNGSPGRPWRERHHGFLAIGRISPEKELERVMRIVAAVRQQVPDTTLTIVGTWDRHTRRYYADLRRQAEALGPWIQFAHDLSRDAIQALMASHRYGLHGMREEHFGMAPAEMTLAGMLVWVADGGGQVEVVGGQADLVYTDDADAVAKIVAVMRDEDRAQRLRSWLAGYATRFTTARFMAELQDVVRTFSAD